MFGWGEGSKIHHKLFWELQSLLCFHCLWWNQPSLCHQFPDTGLSPETRGDRHPFLWEQRVLRREGAGRGSGSTPIPPSCMCLQGDEGMEARVFFSIFLKWFRVLSCAPMKDSAVSKASLSPHRQLFYKVKNRELHSARSRCSEEHLT